MLVMLLVQAGLSSPAWACVCNPISGVLPIGEPEDIALPPNGLFRLYEGDEGEAEEEAWGVYDSEGALVPTTWERFPEVGGYTLIELRPDEPMVEGQTYTLRPAHAPEGWDYTVVGEPDLTPPVLHDAWFGPIHRLRNTSCGEVQWTDLDNEPALSDPTVMPRILDVRSGWYWHRPGLAWNDSCGGYPPEDWSGPKEISLVDWAGNESEPIRARTCGCTTSSVGLRWPLALLLGAGLLRRSASRVSRRSARGSHLAGCLVSSAKAPTLQERPVGGG